VDEDLQPAERLRARFHLLIRGACWRFERQVQLLRSAARQAELVLPVLLILGLASRFGAVAVAAVSAVAVYI
jgi:uncharacterized membrane protein YphA (DoxX/SURF4 family)